MKPIELLIERDKLREKGVDIIVMPTRCGHHSIKRNYTYEVYYRTDDPKYDNDEPSRPLGLWPNYNEALEDAIRNAKETLERFKKIG